MAIERSAFRSQLRESLGRISIREWDDGLIDLVIDRATKRISEYAPRMSQFDLSIVADSTYYTAPSGLLVIYEDSWSARSNGSSVARSFETALGGSVVSRASSTSRSIDLLIDSIENEMLQDNCEHTLLLHGNQIVVLPTPTSAEIIKCHGGFQWSLETYPETWIESLRLQCLIYGAEEILALRDKFPGINVGGTSINMSNAYLSRSLPIWESRLKSSLNTVGFRI